MVVASTLSRRLTAISEDLFRLEFSVPSQTNPTLNTTLENLRAELSRFQQSLRTPDEDRRALSTGLNELDQLLPEKGLMPGTLSEWISAHEGSGAMTLAMLVAKQIQTTGPLVVVDQSRQFYPTAMAALGIDLQNTMFVHPKTRADELWAVEQSLRCEGIAAVVFQLQHLRTPEFRRLQLAAESGRAIGLLLRPAIARRHSGWADVRLMVKALPSIAHSFVRHLEVRCVYAKAAFNDQALQLEVCDETNTVRVASRLSSTASGVSAAGA